ncbi:hypothetical protein K2173_013827 [Erythroxylum novogranatense]|uniref:FHA domain-containing protein n=1 Tax=Erythroxylum novogranatense TaxID=1862640 RepID=A0AAV8SCN8_9ROSI|nr:hypothetical protein K2173_013827 [Erythroxylum novogranatense]
MDVASRSLSHAKFPPIFHSKPSVLASSPISLHSTSTHFSQLLRAGIKVRKQKSFGGTHASSESASTASAIEDRWLLVPAGDGDSRHIGYKVEMPGVYEIASSEVTVGRLPEKADVVIPVATVSALHARIQKKEGNLLVTDLDSTNGTFVNEKRLRPGVLATVPSGSYIVFGDIHLAMFRASKVEKVEASIKPEEAKNEAETESPTESSSPT